MKPRYEQHYTTDMASGEPGLVIRRKSDGADRFAAFIFESEDEDGIHWVAPGFDNPWDMANSNRSEIGEIETGGEAIVSIHRPNDGTIEVLRNPLREPLNEGATRQLQRFVENLGDETLESARQRAFEQLRQAYGMDL